MVLIQCKGALRKSGSSVLLGEILKKNDRSDYRELDVVNRLVAEF